MAQSSIPRALAHPSPAATGSGNHHLRIPRARRKLLPAAEGTVGRAGTSEPGLDPQWGDRPVGRRGQPQQLWWVGGKDPQCLEPAKIRVVIPAGLRSPIAWGYGQLGERPPLRCLAGLRCSLRLLWLAPLRPLRRFSGLRSHAVTWKSCDLDSPRFGGVHALPRILAVTPSTMGLYPLPTAAARADPLSPPACRPAADQEPASKAPVRPAVPSAAGRSFCLARGILKQWLPEPGAAGLG